MIGLEHYLNSLKEEGLKQIIRYLLDNTIGCGRDLIVKQVEEFNKMFPEGGK